MGLFGNGGFINDVTSTINPFDDENGAFQGHGGREHVTPADPGQDLSGQYWDQYGAQAQQNLQNQSSHYQGQMGVLADASAQSGANTNSALQGVGQQSAGVGLGAQQGLNQAGAGYSGQLQGAGAAYANQQSGIGAAAQGYGLGQGAMAQQTGQNIGAQGAGLMARGGAAQGVDVSGAQQSALMGLEATEGPSAAQAQLAQATNRNQANALAMARSGRGFGGSASAMSQAADQRAGAQQEAANQSAVLRAQENAAWRGRQAQNIGAAGQLATSQSGLNNQRELALYQQGLQAQQAGAQLGLQGSQLGLQGYGMNQAGANAAAGTYLGALGQGAQLDIGAQQAGASLGLQGLGQQAGAMAQGGQLEQSGYGQGANILGNAANYGVNNQIAQGNVVGQQYGLAQQHQSNVLQANAINNGLAIQQQNMGNQQTGAYIGALGSLGASLAPLAMSDRNEKEGIEPTNVTLSEESPTVVIPQEGTAQAFDPYSQGVGISGPNQAQGSSSSNAAQAASVEQSAKEPSASKKFTQANFDMKNVPKMSGLAGGIGTAMQAGATAAMGDPNVNPITGQSWTQNAGYQPYQMGTQQGMLPVTSDKREKEALRAIEESPGYSYNYKDPEAMGATNGRQFGVMAQDLEKTPAGRSVVKEGPSGQKMVDTSRLTLVNTAAMNALTERLAKLESRIGGKGKAA